VPTFIAVSPEYRDLTCGLLQSIPDTWHPLTRLEASQKIFVEQVGPARQMIKHRHAHTC